ncbi:hypothetical protein STEG23_016830 [Scotinomys teguina]
MENGAEELAKLQEERSEKSEKGSHCKEQGACGGGNLYPPLPSLEDLCLASTDAKESESNSEAEPEEEPARRNQCERDKSRRRKSRKGERYHEPLDFKVIKSLAESVRTYGITASFTLAQVEALSRHCITPNDWSGLARACLSPDAFLIEFAGEEAGANQAAGRAAADRHIGPSTGTMGMVKWKDILTGIWNGPDPVLVWARGSVCVFPQDRQDPIWVPERLVQDAGNIRDAKLPLDILLCEYESCTTTNGLGQSASPVEVVDVLGPSWALLWTRCGIIQQKAHHQDCQDFRRSSLLPGRNPVLDLRAPFRPRHSLPHHSIHSGFWVACVLKWNWGFRFVRKGFGSRATSLEPYKLSESVLNGLHLQAKMGRRQCKSAYNIIKNKTTPESSPPPTPKSDYCNADKAEENNLKKSLMKMLEKAIEEKNEKCQ